MSIGPSEEMGDYILMLAEIKQWHFTAICSSQSLLAFSFHCASTDWSPDEFCTRNSTPYCCHVS